MNDIRINRRLFIFGLFCTIICFILLLLHVAKTCINEQQVIPNNELPIIYAVTPTYARPVQKAELTRLAQTLLLVPNVFWVIVEDADSTSELVRNLLIQKRLDSRSMQLNAKTPKNFKLKHDDANWLKPRGVIQRNHALSWIRMKLNIDLKQPSVVYFMDDDNTYSTELFDEMARIEIGRVGVWPVGLVGGLNVERPLLNDEGVVTGFNSVWQPSRPFPIDMAGFAISGNLLQRFPDAEFSYSVERGFQESELLRYLVTRDKLQPLANQCQEILVWHTRTESPSLEAEKKLQLKGLSSNDGIEV